MKGTRAASNKSTACLFPWIAILWVVLKKVAVIWPNSLERRIMLLSLLPALSKWLTPLRRVRGMPERLMSKFWVSSNMIHSLNSETATI